MEKKELSPEAKEWLLALLKQLTFNLTATQMEATLKLYREVVAFLTEE